MALGSLVQLVIRFEKVNSNDKKIRHDVNSRDGTMAMRTKHKQYLKYFQEHEFIYIYIYFFLEHEFI